MTLKFLVPGFLAVIAGAAGAVLVSRSFSVRDELGRLCGKGHLVAMVHGEAIYEADVDRAVAEIQARHGPAEADTNETLPSRESIISEIAKNAAAARLASSEKVSAGEIGREFNLLQFQFRDRNAFLTALHTSGLSEWSLRRIISNNLRTRRWIDRAIATQLKVTTEECAEFYKAHAQEFVQPLRLRVSHLFLAAPPETPPEIVDQKKEKIETLAKRVKAGENLADLIGAESEDEATKPRGGDLGFFAASRMPEDFFRAAEKLRPGEISPPVQTELGFHLIRALELKLAGRLSLDQAGEEIAGILTDEKRPGALRKLDADLASQIRFGPRILPDRP
jgi:hypothetical protein